MRHACREMWAKVIESSSTYLVAEGQSRRSTCPVGSASAVLLAACVALGCSEYKPASDTVESLVGSLEPGGSTSDWSCVDPGMRVAPRPVFSQTVDRLVYSFQLVDLSNGQLYPDVRVRACGLSDINCENPVTDMLQVDAEGWVDIPLFRNFTGFLEIRSAAAVSTLFYLNDPVEESTVEYPVGLISIESLGPLVQLLGVQPQANTGIVALRVFDCDGNTASGVSLSTNNAGLPWYFVDGLPSSTSRGTGADGLTGLVNVEPGLAEVDVRAPNGISVDGMQSVVVRPNWLTYGYVRPAAATVRVSR
jgi:hypothetical protein